MVDIKCIAAETNISLILAKNLISLTLIDYDGTKSDELEIIVSNTILRPEEEDKIKLWIDHSFYGIFSVGPTETNDLNQLIITATSANFSQSLKTKQNRTTKKSWVEGDLSKSLKK